ncbi:MAG: outer membrane lipoprotein chaperone LolA [Myxococcales bacterium]|nr:outer membrane lipoprotein chaperone LolA [Myxococcales bacterium]
MHRLLRAVFGLLIATTPTGAQKPKAHDPIPVKAPADPAKELVGRIQKFYENTTDLHAKFEQALASGIGGRKKASGELWLKKPGRMRWEYAKPEKKLMIADGQTLWVYEPEDEQAFRQDMKSSSLPSSVTFLWGAGKLGDEFAVTVEKIDGLGAPGDVVLKLVPQKATAQYRYLVFVVDGKSAMVKETVVYDQQGGTNHMTFRDTETNKGVTDAKFAFTPPTGTKVIRP